MPTIRDHKTGAEQGLVAPRGDQALLLLRQEILSMTFAPGEAVSERFLQDRYGVSRTPIRQALAMLVQQGLINRGARGGYEVAPIDIQEIHALFEYREEVEDDAVRLASRRASPEGLAALRATVDRGRADIDPEEWLAQGLDIHVELAALSGNVFLRDAVQNAVARALRLRWLLASDPAQRETAWTEHCAILDHVAARNEEAAAEAVRLHTRAVRDQILVAVGNAKRFLGTRGIVDSTAQD
ncbi:GntR family transcriptional regulator [Pseudooceanicola spongiae]|uniref:FCD domain-containing protein n=1 Tax=Pseudooceanicola spongiae TaxID=2613965 RepID=A0A7L9WL80_9RHOB|nr:GntR family transcriptional regulator [Pseudooceanicola spongiae]QOL80146.1 FCD domain-containing protein [Pseudooceanicola spongiae]